MLVVQNRLPVADEYEEEFIARFEESVEEIRSRPGLRKVEVLRPTADGPHVVQAYWESREAFEDWRGSEDFRAAHDGIPEEMFTGSNELAVYERARKFADEH